MITSKLHNKGILLFFITLFSVMNGCFGNTTSAANISISHSKNRSFTDKNRQDQALEVDVLVLSLEEFALEANTIPQPHFVPLLGLLQRQAALHHSRAIVPYYCFSKTITPSLSSYKLLYPFHCFS